MFHESRWVQYRARKGSVRERRKGDFESRRNMRIFFLVYFLINIIRKFIFKSGLKI